MNTVSSHLSNIPPNEPIKKYLVALRRYPLAKRLVLNTKLRPSTIEPAPSTSYFSPFIKIRRNNPALTEENRAIVEHFSKTLGAAYGEKVASFIFPEAQRAIALEQGLSSQAVIELLDAASHASENPHTLQQASSLERTQPVSQTLQDLGEAIAKEHFKLPSAIRNLQQKDLRGDTLAENKRLIQRTKEIFKDVLKKETSRTLSSHESLLLEKAKAALASATITKLQAKYVADQAAHDPFILHGLSLDTDEVEEDIEPATQKNSYQQFRTQLSPQKTKRPDYNSQLLTEGLSEQVEKTALLFQKAKQAEESAFANLQKVKKELLTATTPLSTKALHQHTLDLQKTAPRTPGSTSGATTSEDHETESINSDSSYTTALEEPELDLTWRDVPDSEEKK